MDSHFKKIFITGISGLTGIYLSKYFLSKNFEVFGITNNKENLNKNIFECDLLDSLKLSSIINEIQPNIIIHLAAISFVGHENISEIYETNVIGTKNLLEAAKLIYKNSLKKILLASSATIYGNQLINELSEDLKPNPVNHYGISKLAMELVAKMYFNDLPIIITRPFNYSAPEQNINFVIPKITKAFKEKSKTLELGNIDVFREYNSIEFICECYYLLSLCDYKSEIVNLSSGNTHSLNEIISICSKLSNHNLEIKINQNFVRQNEIIKLSGNPNKLNKMISIQNKYSIEKTLESFYN